MIREKRSVIIIIISLLVFSVSVVPNLPFFPAINVSQAAEPPHNTDIENEMERIQTELLSLLTDLTTTQQYSSELLNQGFSLVGKWTCLYLQRHPETSADTLVDALEALNIAPDPIDKWGSFNRNLSYGIFISHVLYSHVALDFSRLFESGPSL